jgi:hypothetical protein
MKSVEAQLSKFDASTKKAGASMNDAAGNANRMSLAAFALGQVIRDSGFFAQNFALGILAISNNIPILIDQLTKLLALSAGVATAISLVASVLTAGLTIWAYSAMAAKDAGEEYEKAMEKANASSQAQVATFNALLAIARDTNLSYAERKQAVDKLNSGYEGLNKTLTVANVNDKESIELTNKVASALVLQAEATAIATLAGEAYVENLRAKNSAVQEYAATENQVYAQILRNLGFFTKAEQVLIEDGAKNREKTINDSQKKYDDYAKKLEEINKKLAKSGMLDPSAPKGASDYKKALDNLSDSLKKIGVDSSLAFSDVVTRKIDAYNRAIADLSVINTKQAADKIDELKNSLFGLKKELFAIEGREFGAKLFSGRIKQDAEDSIKELDNLNAEIQKGLDTDELQKKNDLVAESFANMSEQVRMILQEGLINTISESFIGMGEAIVNGTNVAAGAIGGLLNAASGMFAQFGQGLIRTAIETAILTTGIGKAIEGIKAALTSLKGPLAIAAGVALLALAGAARAGARSIAGGGSASGGGAASSTPFGSSFGGMRGITAFPNSTNNGQIGNVIAETKISGNDLSILIKRADNNRNEYF